MLRYMLDTDICIFVLRNRPAEVREKFRRFEDELCISAITVGELFYGVERSARRLENRRAVEEFIGDLMVLPFTIRGAAHFAQLRAELPAGTRLVTPGLRPSGEAASDDQKRVMTPAAAARAGAKAHRTKLATASWKAHGDTPFFGRLANGRGSFTVRKYDEVMAWFASPLNWSAGIVPPMVIDLFANLEKKDTAA